MLNKQETACYFLRKRSDLHKRCRCSTDSFACDTEPSQEKHWWF